MKFLKLSCILSLSMHFAFGSNSQEQSLSFEPSQGCVAKGSNSQNTFQIGTSAFSTTNPSKWYTIKTHNYPTIVPLSLHRNSGCAQGNIHGTSTGLKIRKSGNYSITFFAVLLNNNPSQTPVIPIIVARNGKIQPNSSSSVGVVASLPTGVVITVQGAGILKNVKSGTKLSLVASNGGNPTPVPITIIGWSMSLYKIP